MTSLILEASTDLSTLSKPIRSDQHHLLTPSRLTYTFYLASPIVITELWYSSCKRCTPVAGYSLKNWRGQFAGKPTCSQSSRGLINSCTSQLAETFDLTFALNNR